MTIINERDLRIAVAQSAADILEDANSYEEAMDWAHEAAGSYAECIYYNKAHAFIAGCDTDNGREFVAECFGDEALDYDDLACRIAYGEIQARLSAAVHMAYNSKLEMI